MHKRYYLCVCAKTYYTARPCGWYYNDMRAKTIIEYRMRKGYYLCVCAKTYYTARPCGWYYNDMRTKKAFEYGCNLFQTNREVRLSE